MLTLHRWALHLQGFLQPDFSPLLFSPVFYIQLRTIYQQFRKPHIYSCLKPLLLHFLPPFFLVSPLYELPAAPSSLHSGLAFFFCALQYQPIEGLDRHFVAVLASVGNYAWHVLGSM